jgi:hypothetical protein
MLASKMAHLSIATSWAWWLEHNDAMELYINLVTVQGSVYKLQPVNMPWTQWALHMAVYLEHAVVKIFILTYA